MALAGDLADISAADMAHAFFVQGFEHGAAEVTGDSAFLQSQQQRAIGRVGAHVYQCRNLNSLLMQIQRCKVSIIIAGQHHRSVTRFDCIELHQALCGAGQHHTR
ncbi:hypothetical protein D3C73_1291750 [compost metagenome]